LGSILFYIMVHQLPLKDMGHNLTNGAKRKKTGQSAKQVGRGGLKGATEVKIF